MQLSDIDAHAGDVQELQFPDNEKFFTVVLIQLLRLPVFKADLLHLEVEEDRADWTHGL